MRCAAILTKKRGLLRSNLLLVERLPLRVRPVFDGVVLDEVGLFHRRLPRYQEAVGILRHRQVPRRSWFWSCAEEHTPRVRPSCWKLGFTHVKNQVKCGGQQDLLVVTRELASRRGGTQGINWHLEECRVTHLKSITFKGE